MRTETTSIYRVSENPIQFRQDVRTWAFNTSIDKWEWVSSPDGFNERHHSHWTFSNDMPTIDPITAHGSPQAMRVVNEFRSTVIGLNESSSRKLAELIDRHCLPAPSKVDRDSLLASCDCLTKTPDHRYHKPSCRYRLICECNIAREDAKHYGEEVRTLRASFTPNGALARENESLRQQLAELHQKYVAAINGNILCQQTENALRFQLAVLLKKYRRAFDGLMLIRSGEEKAQGIASVVTQELIDMGDSSDEQPPALEVREAVEKVLRRHVWHQPTRESMVKEILAAITPFPAPSTSAVREAIEKLVSSAVSVPSTPYPEFREDRIRYYTDRITALFHPKKHE